MRVLAGGGERLQQRACPAPSPSIGYLIRNHLADDALGCAVQDQVQVAEVPLDDVLAVRALQWYTASLPLRVPSSTMQYPSSTTQYPSSTCG